MVAAVAVAVAEVEVVALVVVVIVVELIIVTCLLFFRNNQSLGEIMFVRYVLYYK